MGPTGRAEAEFYLQGPHGSTGDSVIPCEEHSCTLPGTLIIGGSIEAWGGDFSDTLAVSGRCTLGELRAESIYVERTIWLPECPRGYHRDEATESFVLCRRDLGDGVLDEMVKVGSVWVDRYEASVCAQSDCRDTIYGSSGDDWADAEGFPPDGQLTTAHYAASIEGIFPTRWITWFQAAAACAASGKHLVTSAEWQAAVAGTEDPERWGGRDGRCVTDGSVRFTGTGNRCVSHWGAQDLIGNLWEWTADWVGHQTGSASAGTDDYLQDGWWNIYPAEMQDEDSGFPAALIRGGALDDTNGAGAFALDLRRAPTERHEFLGFRCATAY